jgi:CMP-2-keto-3-deoxyoctulosonic acid synthetase
MVKYCLIKPERYVQGDEPMLGEQVIKQVANNLANSKMQMATLCENVLDKAQYLDPNCVKVVFGAQASATCIPSPSFSTLSCSNFSTCS